MISHDSLGLGEKEKITFLLLKKNDPVFAEDSAGMNIMTLWI